MKRFITGISLSLLVVACGGDDTDVLSDQNIESVVFIQRPPRLGGLGDIFQYTSYEPGARLVKLTPPTADGELEVLCCDAAVHGAEFADVDISSFDIDFDAQRIVFSARLSADQRFGLFILTLADGKVEQLSTNPSRDYVYPIFVPGNKILFMTNDVVEEGAPQHRDEYERGTTTQLGVMSADGSEHALGARNLSHRVFPTLLSDGRVMMTQWDHLGDMNAGHLVIVNPDMSVVREAYGKEGSGVANSYLKATEVSPGRVVTIATSRDGTLQAGSLLLVNLGETYPCADDPSKSGFAGGDVCADRNMSEANASYKILTPQVPRDDEPSFLTIGRYYDAYAVTRGEHPHLLVSWADGPVDDMTLGDTGTAPDFGVFLFDSRTGTRRPIYNDKDYWDVQPRPLRARTAPPEIPASGGNGFDDGAVLMGSMNVYESTINQFEPGSVYGVRILEGFSTEEGVPDDFGLTEHEGSALIGVAPVMTDGSWAALIPANVPVHLQPIDIFGMALASEPVWISGNAGESRFCGGCHEDRAATTVIQPGVSEAVLAGPLNFVTTRNERFSRDYSRDAIVGVPWGSDSPDDPSGTGAVQAIFNAKCIGCHDGDPAKPGNKTLTIMDTETGDMQTIVFDLRGHEVEYGVGETIVSGYTASHLSLLGPDMMELEEENPNIIVMGELTPYIVPNEARSSVLIQKLNPPQLYPSYDPNVRAFDGPIHPVDVGGEELTEDEYHILILKADEGGQYYSRENAPGFTLYP